MGLKANASKKMFKSVKVVDLNYLTILIYLDKC